MNYSSNLTNDIEQPNFSSLTLRAILILTINLVLIITIFFSIKIYFYNQRKTITNLSREAKLLKHKFEEIMYRTTELMNFVENEVKTQAAPKELEHIFQNYLARLVEVENSVLGWSNVMWINNELKAIISSNHTIVTMPPGYAKLNAHVFSSSLVPNKIFYGMDRFTQNMQISRGVVDRDNQYLGSIIIEFNANNFIKKFDNRKLGLGNTFFGILDHELFVILQSSSKLNSALKIEEEKVTESRIVDLMTSKLWIHDNVSQQKFEDLYEVDILRGINYYITKVDNYPFLIVVHIDPKCLKNKLVDKILTMLIEVFLLAICFIVVIVSIYKRETWLRAKAEQAYEVAKKATKAKSQFLAFAAHEIRSPLGFILTGSEILKKNMLGDLPAVYKQYAEGIHNNSKLILDFITDILDDIQIVSCNFKITLSQVKLNKVISEAISTNLTKFQDRRVAIQTMMPDKLPIVFCDKRRMLQVFSNLISNAIKYSPDNTTVMIKVKLFGRGLRISIIDQGIGMTSEEINISLKKYGTTHNKLGGIESYGLGLSIVQLLLEAHKAEFKILSKKNLGTRVDILLPNHMLKNKI